MRRLAIAAAFALMAHGASAMVFGIHVHNPERIPEAGQLGYQALRMWDIGTSWESLMPQPQLWRFDRAESILAASANANMKVIWTLGNTPQWASARPTEKCSYEPGCAAEPKNIEDWRRYVRTVATTFRGRVECYEPWNEVSFPHDPAFVVAGSGGDDHQFFTGSLEALARLTRVAYEEIHRADPEACVLSPSIHSSGNMAEKLDRLLSTLGGRYFDAISLHHYFGSEPEDVVPAIRAMRQVLNKHGFAALPVWNTEVGVNFIQKAQTRLNMTPETAAYAMILRTYLINASERIDRVYWYAWDNGGLGFKDPVSGRYFALDAVAAALADAKSIESADCKPVGHLWTCTVVAGARRFSIAWVSGEREPAQSYLIGQSARRWGQPVEYFSAGQRISLDGRPVIIEAQ